MAIELFQHNMQAYDAALSMLDDVGKAAIIHPTGTGKSFIGFKLCEEHPQKTICWLSPSEYIFKTQIENWEKAGGEPISNIRFFTYARLINLTREELGEICPDYIILDEFHRCGAEIWGAGVQRLLQMYEQVSILGLSATAIRYLDNQRNMADELFNGNIASEITLGDAIVRGILNPPKYVLSVFYYQKMLEKYKKRVQLAKSKAVRDSGEQYLEALRRALDKAEGLDVIFEKHMTEQHGKYLVFCANAEHMADMIEKAPKWFAKVDKKPHIYSAYSEDPETSRTFAEFKADDSDHLKLLFCIDMLNEGIHVDDVAGVILLRPTVSPIIYKQQIGRALSANKKHEPVIFDIVLNIENLYSIGAIEEEMQAAITYYRAHGESSEIINEHFRIVDEVRDCRELFDRLNESLTASWDLMYECAKKYYQEYGNLDIPRRYTTEEGYSLGTWLCTQRKVRDEKQYGILTEEQIQRLDAIGMRWDSVRDINWERYYAAAKAYYEEHGNLLVNVSDNKYHGVTLGRWIAQLRTYRKSGIQSSYLTAERIAALDALGMVWDVPDYLWETNYHAAVQYHREHGNLDVPHKYVDPDGIKLGSWIYYLRASRNNPNYVGASLTEDQIKRLDALGMLWESRHNIAWNRSYEIACHYFEEHGDLNVPAAYVSADGIALGKWIGHQRTAYKNSMPPERVQKLERIGMVWNSDPWLEKMEMVRRYYAEHGDVNMPNNYVVDGIWLARWLSEQMARLSEKPTGRSKTVKPLTEEQKKCLAEVGILPNISRFDVAWQEQYDELKAFYEEYGHIQIPKRYVSASGKRLGSWLQNQRNKQRNGQLTKEQTALLDELGIVWSYDKVWDSVFDRCVIYKNQFGNLDIPLSYVCEDDYKLGRWIQNQRSAYNGTSNKTLKPEQIKRLEALGMIWDVNARRWEQAYLLAKEYARKHGDLNVPRHFKTESGFDLYDWLKRQRDDYKQGKLKKEQISKLNALKIDWLPPQERAWETGFDHARRYYEKNGNLYLSARYQDEDGYSLGLWVRNQRKDKEKLSQAQIARLSAVGMVWEKTDLRYKEQTVTIRSEAV